MMASGCMRMSRCGSSCADGPRASRSAARRTTTRRRRPAHQDPPHRLRQPRPPDRAAQTSLPPSTRAPGRSRPRGRPIPRASARGTARRSASSRSTASRPSATATLRTAGLHDSRKRQEQSIRARGRRPPGVLHVRLHHERLRRHPEVRRALTRRVRRADSRATRRADSGWPGRSNSPASPHQGMSSTVRGCVRGRG